MTEHIRNCGDKTKERIGWLMNVEKRPYTLNTHYYSDYKDKFLSFYRGCREMGNNGQIMKNLQSYKPIVPNSYSTPTPVQTGVAQVLSALPQIGITGTQAPDLAKLFAPDPMESALNIMAGVRAYFQGSCSTLGCNITDTDRLTFQSRTSDLRISFLWPLIMSSCLVSSGTFKLLF
jgi:hypothetical protein